MARKKRYYSNNPYRMRRRYTSQPTWDSELVVLILKLGILSTLVGIALFVIASVVVLAVILAGVAIVVGLFVLSGKHFGWGVTLKVAGVVAVVLLMLISLPALIDFLTFDTTGGSALPTLAPTVAPLDVP